jgi:hypothetical protein
MHAPVGARFSLHVTRLLRRANGAARGCLSGNQVIEGRYSRSADLKQLASVIQAGPSVGHCAILTNQVQQGGIS